ncbi:MAG: serine protease [Desulfitobacteriaceae bacterium]|nr:serine protease [Desulfitobacteriaceae bacterium]MDD4345803.1 serine protease [Desulfitobacteriaceae bacterium]MDD4402265.1 serine protease [Desulfitobacteriaceae bacterium]
MNDDKFREYTDEEEQTEYETKDNRKFGCLLKIIALVILLAFLAISVPNFPLLLSEKLKFIDQNTLLREDEIVQKCKPAVVSIEAAVKNETSADGVYLGTGFNISPTGKIITNRHIVANAESITVSFADGREFSSEQYEIIPNMDIAVINLQTNDLPTVSLNLTDPIREGDLVTIIGNPLGYKSIAQRGQAGQFHKMEADRLLVFDVNITVNPGNSGSPVINSRMQVVGVIFASANLKINEKSESRALAIPVQSIPQEYLQ